MLLLINEVDSNFHLIKSTDEQQKVNRWSNRCFSKLILFFWLDSVKNNLRYCCRWIEKKSIVTYIRIKTSHCMIFWIPKWCFFLFKLKRSLWILIIPFILLPIAIQKKLLFSLCNKTNDFKCELSVSIWIVFLFAKYFRFYNFSLSFTLHPSIS